MNALLNLCRALTAIFALLLAPAKASAANVPAADQPAAAVGFYSLSPGRLGSIVGGVLGLIGIVSGSSALARRVRPESGARRRAIVALTAGVLGMALGIWVVVTADGGLGTGNGLGGGIVACVIGAIASALGGLALSRARRCR